MKVTFFSAALFSSGPSFSFASRSPPRPLPRQALRKGNLSEIYDLRDEIQRLIFLKLLPGQCDARPV